MSRTSLSDTPSIDKEKTIYVAKDTELSNGVITDVEELRHINDRFDGTFTDDDLLFIAGHLNDRTFKNVSRLSASPLLNTMTILPWNAKH